MQEQVGTRGLALRLRGALELPGCSGGGVRYHADRLRAAAEHWAEVSKSHWAAGWGTSRVNRFLEMATGATPAAGTVPGRRLVAMAVQSLVKRNEDLEREFATLVPLSVHRRKIVRLLMQKTPPELDSLLMDTPRDEVTLQREQPEQAVAEQSVGGLRGEQHCRCACAESKVSAETADYEFERMLREVEGPVVSVVRPAELVPKEPHVLRFSLSTPAFLLRKRKEARAAERRAEESQLDPHAEEVAPKCEAGRLSESALPRPGVEVCIVPRFSHEEISVNPSKQAFRWMREHHELSFDLEWNGESEEASNKIADPLHEAECILEVWVGPVMVGLKRVRMELGDAPDPDESQTASLQRRRAQRHIEEPGHLFNSVLLVYSPKDTSLLQAIGRVEQQLKGCVELVHTHQLAQEKAAGSTINSFSAASYTRHTKSIQLCLSQGAQACRTFFKAAEVLARSVAHEQRTGRLLPEILALFWAHPKPDVAGHPVLSKIHARFRMVFFNDWLLCQPEMLCDGGFRTADIHDVAGQLQQGVPVAFRNHQHQWERGRIASQSDTPAHFHVVSDTSGGLLKNVPVNEIRILGADSTFPDAAERDRQQARASERANKGRTLLASLRVGDSVFARNAHRREYKAGVIVGIHDTARSVDIAFEDGRAETHVALRFLRLPPSRATAVRPKTASPRHRVRGAAGPTDFRAATTGELAHGLLVQVTMGRDGRKFLGRVRGAQEYGLKYDVMLANGELVQGVPVHLISPMAAAAGGANGEPKHTYVDAICDRFHEILSREACVSPNGANLRLHFESLDLDGDGVLSAPEMKDALERLGFRPSEKEVLEVMDRISEKSCGSVDYGDFVRFALPFGVSGRQRQLKKSIAYYEMQLESVNLMYQFERAVGSDLGRVWLAFVDRDQGNTGWLSEAEFLQCLLHVNVGLSAEQRQRVVKCFGNGHDKMDYREFAAVIELLLARRMERASENKGTKESLTVGVEGPMTDAPSRRSPRTLQLSGRLDKATKQERLRIEHKASRRIQALCRMRRARKLIAMRRRMREGAAVAEKKRANAPWWVAAASAAAAGGSAKSAGEGASEEKERAEAISRWRELLKLNTKNSLEIGAVFRSMDSNCDGLISLQELAAALKRHNMPTRFATLLFREMDMGNDGLIDLTDVKMFVAGHHRRRTEMSGPRQGYTGQQVLLEELGKDMCDRLRRYHAVLQRCGTDLLERLVCRPKTHTIVGVLRKQGFVLGTAEWQQLESLVESMADSRGDRVVCEDLVSLLSADDKELLEHQHAFELKNVKDYLQGKGVDADAPRELGALVHKVTAALERLCNDPEQRRNKHRKLWWLMTINEAGGALTLDRVDLELLLLDLGIQFGKGETQMLMAALDESGSGRFGAGELAKLLHVSRKVHEYLEVDYVHSRFSKSYVLAQRQRLASNRAQQQSRTRLPQLRRKGVLAYARWLREHLGAACFKKMRAMLAAADKRGNALYSGEWLCERLRARLGYVQLTHFSRSLQELGLHLQTAELDNLARLVASDAELDVFEFADLCRAVMFTSPAALSNEDERSTTLDKKTSQVLFDFINDRSRYKDARAGHRHLLETFMSFDIQGNGTIEKGELMHVFSKLGLDVSAINLQRMFEVFDADGDGHIHYREFLDALQVKRKTASGMNGARGAVPSVREAAIIDKLVPAASKNRLCKEDIEDACASVMGKGLLSRRDVQGVLSTLNLTSALRDEEDLKRLQRLTRRQLQQLLETVLIMRTRKDVLSSGASATPSARVEVLHPHDKVYYSAEVVGRYQGLAKVVFPNGERLWVSEPSVRIVGEAPPPRKPESRNHYGYC